MQKRPKGWQTALDDANHTGELLVKIAGQTCAAQDIVSCEVERNLLDSTAEIGNAAAAVMTLQVAMGSAVPRQAEIVLQYRLRLGDAYTDYIPKGVYWVNTREADGRYIKLTCYDAMLKAEQEYLTEVTDDDWPKSEQDCAEEIAARIGVEIDPRTAIGTGKAHMVNMPIGKTMREVLRQIAVTNAGNWCITDAGKLLLVPLAGTGDNVAPVGGRPDTGTQIAFAGVRLLREGEDTPYTAGRTDGNVLEAALPEGEQANADEIWEKVKSVLYRPYKCEQRHIDPLAENGDTLEIGGQTYVLYNIKQSIGPSFYADLQAPADAGELEQEYPYLKSAERVKKQIVTLQRSTAEIRKTQENIEGEVTKTKEDVAKNKDDIQAAMDAAAEKSEAALTAAKDYTAEQLKSYSTTEETKSLISQTAESIEATVSKTYVTTAVFKDGQQDTLTAAKDYTAEQLKSYSTTEETKSLINQTAESIEATVSKTYVTTAVFKDGQQDTLTAAKDYTAEQLKSYSTTEETKSLISQTAESITVEVSKTYQTTAEANSRLPGSGNMVLGSANFELKDGKWVDTGGCAEGALGSYAASGEMAHVVNVNQNTRYGFQCDKSKIKKGVSYCISVLYKHISGEDGLMLQFEGIDGSGRYVGIQQCKRAAQKNIEQSDGWVLAYATFVASADCSANTLFLSCGEDYQTHTNDYYLMHPQVCEGNAPSAWSPAAADYAKATEIRSKFAMDASNVSIESGRVAFKAGTITIESGNFKLAENGEVTASGTFSTDNGSGQCVMTNGELTLRRRLSNGRMVDGVFLSAWGNTESIGRMVVYGPTGENIYVGVAIAGYYSGGAIAINNASGQTKIQMGIDGNGDGYVAVNGNWYT